MTQSTMNGRTITWKVRICAFYGVDLGIASGISLGAHTVSSFNLTVGMIGGLVESSATFEKGREQKHTER